MGAHKQTGDNITLDTADSALYWLGSCGRSTVKCGTGFLLFLQFYHFSLLMAVGQGFCKHWLCGQKVYSPCFIDFTEFRVGGDQYQGQWRHVTLEMIRDQVFTFPCSPCWVRIQNIISALVSCQCLRALASELPCVPTLVMLGYEQWACSNAASGDSSAVNILQRQRKWPMNIKCSTHGLCWSI